MKMPRIPASRQSILFRRAEALVKDESGYALLAVLILLAVGGLMLPPLLGLVSTSLLLEDVREGTVKEFYAADAGVEDALWQIKADELPTLFPDYDQYDYSSSYAYSAYPDSASAPSLNEKDVDITIRNVWIPQGIPAPSPEEAQQIIDDGILVVTGKATDADTYRIRITYNWQEVSDPDWEDLEVDQIGIWLPPGFSYVPESSNLEEDSDDDYYCVPTVEAYKSGQAIIWSFGAGVAFTDMPGVNAGGYPLVASITFDFASAGAGAPDAALAWTTTSEVAGVDFAWDADVRVFQVQSTATSPATGSHTVIDAYTARGEIRRISAAIPGDYYATGNSLITSTDSNDDYRNRLMKESSATIPTDDSGNGGIPTQGIPEAAYLYWTGWIDWHGYDPEPIFYDNCSDMSDWVPVDRWTLSSGTFRGRGTPLPNIDARTLMKNPSLDLSAHAAETVTISWDQSEWASNLSSSEGLFYAFSGDGGDTWSTNYTAFLNDNPPSSFSTPIPDDYLTADFRVRFYFNFNSTSEYVYIDNITIWGAASTLRYPDDPTIENLTALITDAARTNTILLEAGGSDPVEISANRWEIEPTTGTDWEDTWSYCCYADVTDVVRQWIEDGDLENNAAGTYTLGHKIAANAADSDFSFSLYNPSGPNPQTGYPLGTPAPYPDDRSAARYQYSHAGWSLIVIYTSPETRGHQLYLFDIQDPDFNFTEAWGPSGNPNPDFDGDGQPGGRIAGFLVPDPIAGEIVAAKMTVFVGEGDSLINGDRAQLNGHSLSNSASPSTNVWNSASPGMSVPGVDIDTFVVEWDDGILETGDTSAQVDLPTRASNPSDGFNLVYIVLSFRSDVTSGGTISFLVSG